VCELAGELDLMSSDLVRSSLVAAATDVRPLTLDLHHLEFFGAAGVRIVEEISALRNAVGRPFVVTGASPLVIRLLEALGVSRSVEIHGRSHRSRGACTAAGRPHLRVRSER